MHEIGNCPDCRLTSDWCRSDSFQPLLHFAELCFPSVFVLYTSKICSFSLRKLTTLHLFFSLHSFHDCLSPTNLISFQVKIKMIFFSFIISGFRFLDFEQFKQKLLLCLTHSPDSQKIQEILLQLMRQISQENRPNSRQFIAVIKNICKFSILLINLLKTLLLKSH